MKSKTLNSYEQLNSFSETFNIYFFMRDFPKNPSNPSESFSEKEENAENSNNCEGLNSCENSSENRQNPSKTFSEKQLFDEKTKDCKCSNSSGLTIEPMNLCIYGRRCHHLDAPGGVRPTCKLNGEPVFDLDRCPLGLWQKTERR